MGAIRGDAFGGAGPRAASARRRIAGVALLVLAPLLFPLYTANVRIGTAPETLSAALTAHSVAREGDLDLAEYFVDAPIKPRRPAGRGARRDARAAARARLQRLTRGRAR